MAFRAARQEKLLRLLVRTAQNNVGGLAEAEPALACQAASFSRGLKTRSALLEEATSPLHKAPSASAQAGRPYIAVGGALAATAGLVYLLFGGSSPPAPPGTPVAEAQEQPDGLAEEHVGSYKVETHKGTDFGSSELVGEFGLVYFGTSSHPDTVSELERLAEIINQSDRLSNMHYLNPIFVSVDPKTDDKERMANVVSLFDTNHNRTHLRLLGITGEDTQKLHGAALKFGDRTHKPVDKPDTTFFFVSPEGTFIKAYSGLSAPKEIAEDMTDYIVRYKRNNPTWHGPKKVAKRHA